MRLPPEDFVRQLREKYSDFVELRFNEAVSRWEFRFLSAAGTPASLFWGWFRNPLTGERIEPDGVTGLVPFRDVTDLTAQTEIMDSLDKTFLGNRHDGAGTWKKKFDQVSRFNTKVRQDSARRRGEDYAYLIQQMDLRRPWVKDHPRNRGPKIVLPSAGIPS